MIFFLVTQGEEKEMQDVPKSVKYQNTAMSVEDVMNLPTTSGGIPPNRNLAPYNNRVVNQYDPSFTSATVNAFTGIMDTGRLTEVRERAFYDLDSLQWAPVADAGTGVMFPGAVEAKTIVETALRTRPTMFKGPQQLDINPDDADQHFNRQINPNAWKDSNMPWYKNKGDLPFVGYPNPNYFNMYTDSIPTHNVQNLSHAQLTEALKSMEVGNFDNENYLNTVGSLLRSDAVPAAAAASINKVIQSDGGGVNGDPRLVERINQEYEVDFNLSKRIRVADASNDPRWLPTAPGIQYQEQQDDFSRAQETQFSKISELAGAYTGYMNPVAYHVG